MITVFTPTFNRKDTLSDLYGSLLRQTDKDFEWVVVDDGSTDGTETFLREIIAARPPFNVIYEKQENGGKHRAINRGVSLAKGELFFIVDSDDTLKPDAVENIKYFADTLGEGKWAGVAFFREDKSGKPLDNIPEIKDGALKKKDGFSVADKGSNKLAFSKKLAVFNGKNGAVNYIDKRNTERDGAGLSKDKAEVYFTEVLKKYPFPEFEGENFISEEVVWNKIAADGYYLRFVFYPIYVCEYLSGGLTESGDLKYARNPKGTLCWAKGQLKIFRGRKRLAAMERYRSAVGKVKSVKETAADLGVPKASLIAALIIVRGGRKIKRLIGK